VPEPDLVQELAAAAALLLRPPDAAILSALSESAAVEVDSTRATQDFYDVLCVPQSGRYIPPYAHVLIRGQVKDGTWWHFPPPRFDGGDALKPWYDEIGFNPMRLDADPMLKGPHRPLDQAGYIFAYLASFIASRERNNADRLIADSIIAEFAANHLGVWPDRFCNLLCGSGSSYLVAVADAVCEVVQCTRAAFPAPTAEPCVYRKPDPCC